MTASGTSSLDRSDRLEQPVSFRSPLRYPGGKQKAIKEICKRLPSKAKEYREPLVGGGSLYFWARANNFAREYWINDKFRELVSFWRVVQDPGSCCKLMSDLDRMRRQFRSCAEIKRYFLKARERTSLSEYEEALLFFFFNRVTFSGTTRAGGFSRAASQRRFTASSIERLAMMPQALNHTRITNGDFEEVISESGHDVFIFLDPPYYTASKLYGRGGELHQFDHQRLAEILKKTEHKFLITYDDCLAIRKLYKWANLQEWRLQYGMNNCNLDKTSKLGCELFISNY